MVEGVLNPDGSEWVPEFEGQREPFRPGNRLSVGNRGPLKSGADSPRMVEPLAKSIRAELKRTPGLEYLADRAFADVLFAFSRAEARMRLYAAWVDGQPIEVTASDAFGTPPLELLRQMEVKAANLGERLGLSPALPDEVAAAVRAAKTRTAARAARLALREQEKADLKAAMRAAFYPEGDL